MTLLFTNIWFGSVTWKDECNKIVEDDRNAVFSFTKLFWWFKAEVDFLLAVLSK